MSGVSDRDQPMDLGAIDTEPAAGPNAVAAIEPTAVAATATTAVADPSLLATAEPMPRLVDVSGLRPDELEAARDAAGRVDFRNTSSLLGHGNDVLGSLAQASRELLTGVRVGDAGEVGRVAAAVIDGVKILRIEDLQAEAAAGPVAAGRHRGLVGRLFGAVSDAHSAFRGFAESRRRFLDLLDGEQAKARRIQADLAVTIRLLDEQVMAVRQSLHGLKIAIAGGQLALDRGADELETMRQEAVRSGDPSDAAAVLAFRGALANFRSKVADLREALVGSATLIPIITQNRAAAETRMAKISTGLLVVIPRLMAVASQAAVQVDLGRAGAEAEHLDEATRTVTVLAAKGAHEAATGAARALGGDSRNVDALALAAEQAIHTMHEVIAIEREVENGDREREARLAAVRDQLVGGMQGVARHALER